MPQMFSNLMPGIESFLSQRLQGQGMGLEQGYGNLEDTLLRDIMGQGQAQRRNLLGQASISGSGRSGATAAQLMGLDQAVGRQQTDTSAQLGFQRMNALNQAQENAARMGMSLEDMLGNRWLQEQNLAMQQQQYQDQQNPGFGSILGQGLGLAANLFGVGGAFPLMNQRQSPLENRQMDFLDMMMQDQNQSGGSQARFQGGSPFSGPSPDYFSGI